MKAEESSEEACAEPEPRVSCVGPKKAPLRPGWLVPEAWLERARSATREDVLRALSAASPREAELAALLSEAAGGMLEPLARRAEALTRMRRAVSCRATNMYNP